MGRTARRMHLADTRVEASSAQLAYIDSNLFTNGDLSIVSDNNFSSNLTIDADVLIKGKKLDDYILEVVKEHMKDLCFTNILDESI